MKVPVYNMSGETVGDLDLNDQVFGVPMNESLVHQTLITQRSNLRQGTVDTKTRSEVAGSGKKLFAQKHTGNARRGSRRSPVQKGGGVAFGPHPRDYSLSINRKMKQQAIRCLLSEKAREGKIRVVDKIEFDLPRTREVENLLAAVNADFLTLISTKSTDPNLVAGARNLPNVRTVLAAQLNVVDLTSYQTLMLNREAVSKIEDTWGKKAGMEKAKAAG